jgi:RNA polymerase sigma-70 factor (ECF subfamily)
MAWTGEATDEELFTAYCAGDQAAFEALFRRYQGPLGRHLERVMGDRGTAEDLVVETFQRLHVHRRRFRAGAAIRPWVYTIARNLARNRLRRARLARWLPLEAVDAGRPVYETPPPGGDVEVGRRVAAALGNLPMPQREACSLRLLGELTLEEVATVTGASLGTVKSRLFYGQRRLRELLADMDPRIGSGE